MRAERIFGHQLLCHSTRKFRPNASGNVNLRQLLFLEYSIFCKLAPFLCEIGLFRIRL